MMEGGKKLQRMRNFHNLNIALICPLQLSLSLHSLLQSATSISIFCPFLPRCFDAPELWLTSRVMGEAGKCGQMKIYEDICVDICGYMRTY